MRKYPHSRRHTALASGRQPLTAPSARSSGPVPWCSSRQHWRWAQSFALAVLDERGDGFVVSSIFGRAESRLYAKPVKAGKSKYALSDEEEQAIVQAALVR